MSEYTIYRNRHNFGNIYGDMSHILWNFRLFLILCETIIIITGTTALASSNKCRQRLLSWTSIFQFLHPIFLKSCSTPSIRLSFCLPRHLCPPGFEFNIYLVISLSSIRVTWPAHVSLFILIKLIISQSFNISYSSLINLLYIPFSKIGPAILRRILLSNTPNLLSSF